MLALFSLYPCDCAWCCMGGLGHMQPMHCQLPVRMPDSGFTGVHHDVEAQQVGLALE